ncbi:PCC domain-containing protein [Arthrobacter sp. FW306-2-2C-D06B]|uniref:PCC domain-containing protein n=1 Tax=Arthrobacter sp. FW306-2-2C-D06B TaxID=2879618 RepID=UPI001F305B33|nr:PPC domain-containing DNA-binding protein [Arthrobacter sp. FW306-2-2C-D06B]UKA60416.1 DNA-binding protein [Arthrobacter sp. FW306-2-2C-D06B]
MSTIVTGQMGRVIYAHLAPGEDVYEAVIEIARTENISTGLVLDITGGASQLRLTLPKSARRESEASRPPEVIEVKGLAEVMGSGIIGQVKDDFVSADGHVRYKKGDPYAHIHVSATAADGKTYTGHLVEGTLVRSVIAESHFTIALAEVEGVDLSLLVDSTPSNDYPAGVPYHRLRSVEFPAPPEVPRS